MESICALKDEGNDNFKAGLRITSRQNPTRKQHFINACLKYAAALEAIVPLEYEPVTTELNDSAVLFADMKPNLFLNLAMSNFQLLDFQESRRCCNAALAFINDATLLMNQLGEVHDINVDLILVEPLRPSQHKIGAKILFRRAKSLFELDLFDLALRDIAHASSIMPNDSNISAFYKQVQEKVASQKLKMVKTNKAISDNKVSENLGEVTGKCKMNSAAKVDINVDGESQSVSETDLFGQTCFITPATAHLCHNGGLCLLRHAYWSQTITEVSVHIPATYIQQALLKTVHIDNENSKCGSGSEEKDQTSYQLQFKVNCCDITVYNTNIRNKEHSNIPQSKLNLCLASNVAPDECTWYTSDISNINYLVIVFYKVPPSTVFPGCEWWSRVFEGDEKIDTLTCTVGADVFQLPEHARNRAEQEHARFQALSVAEQGEELGAIGSYKQMFQKAEAKTRAQALAEDRAVQEVPQRAEMLEALRDEFPTIQFSAK